MASWTPVNPVNNRLPLPSNTAPRPPPQVLCIPFRRIIPLINNIQYVFDRGGWLTDNRAFYRSIIHKAKRLGPFDKVNIDDLWVVNRDDRTAGARFLRCVLRAGIETCEVNYTAEKGAHHNRAEFVWNVEINSAERGFGGKVYGSPELVLMHKGAWVDGEMEFIDVQDDDIGQQRRSGAYHGNYPPFGTPEFYALYSCSANEDEWSGNVLG